MRSIKLKKSDLVLKVGLGLGLGYPRCRCVILQTCTRVPLPAVTVKRRSIFQVLFTLLEQVTNNQDPLPNLQPSCSANFGVSLPSHKYPFLIISSMRIRPAFQYQNPDYCVL